MCEAQARSVPTADLKTLYLNLANGWRAAAERPEHEGLGTSTLRPGPTRGSALDKQILGDSAFAGRCDYWARKK